MARKRKPSRYAPRFNVDSEIDPSPITVGGQSVHKVTVVAETAIPIRYVVILSIDGSPVVDYVGPHEIDGAVVYKVPYQLSLDMTEVFTPAILHQQQNAPCGKLPHRANIAIQWGDDGDRTQEYNDPMMTRATKFDCTV